MVAISSTLPGSQRPPTYRPARLDLGLLAEQRLHGSNYHVLQAVHCSVEADTLVLTGCLPSYFLKQMAQETVASLPGVSRLVNRIEVTSGVTP